MVEPQWIDAGHRRHHQRRRQRAWNDAAPRARDRSNPREHRRPRHLQIDGVASRRMTPSATAAPSKPSVVAPRPGDPAITPALIAEHGLTTGEYDRLVDMLGRTPTVTGAGIGSA